jgi:hypothetical protein
MPYIKPDVRARTRVAQPEQQPLLSVVSWLTTSPPVVDASKYRSWTPNLDQPPKKVRPPKKLTTQKEAVRRMLAEGHSVKHVATALHMTANAVSTVKFQLKRAGLLVAVPVALPVVAAPVECPVLPQVDHVTAPAPVCLPASPEPPRTYVIDWAARLAHMEFDGEPGKGKPKRMSRKSSSTADFRNVYPWPGLLAPTNINAHASQSHAINCAQALGAAPARGPQPPYVESIKNPFKTGQKGKFFAGSEAVDIEQEWRAACTQ